MGWQDILAKHHPIPAFVAAVISNVITGNKVEENQNPTNTNFYNEPSSSDDYTYGPSDIQPAQYYYPPTPIPSSSSLNKPKKNKNKAYNEGRQIDHYNATNNNEQIVKSNFFWKRKHELVDQGKGYESKGTVRRGYVDQNGEEMVEERDYQFQSYYELQLSPAKVVEPRKNKGDYQGTRKSRYYG